MEVPTLGRVPRFPLSSSGISDIASCGTVMSLSVKSCEGFTNDLLSRVSVSIEVQCEICDLLPRWPE